MQHLPRMVTQSHCALLRVAASVTGASLGGGQCGHHWPVTCMRPRRVPWMTMIVTAVILGALFLPAAAVPQVGIDHLDIAAHMALFGSWMCAAMLEFPQARVWALAVTAIGLGLATELLQHLSPGRTFSWLDLLSDAIGVTLAAGAMVVWRRRRGRSAGVG